jgi:hypothetical protein
MSSSHLVAEDRAALLATRRDELRPLLAAGVSSETYRWGEGLEWVESRLSAPMRSTSEADAP